MKKRKFNITLHPEIKSDLQEAIDYYNSKKKGLGDHFFLIAKNEIKSLEKDALLYTIRFENTRFLKVGDYPYITYYFIIEEENTVYIDAIKSTSRNPETNWVRRS